MLVRLTEVTARKPTLRALHELYVEVKGLSNDERMHGHSTECGLCGEQVGFGVVAAGIGVVPPVVDTRMLKGGKRPIERLGVRQCRADIPS